MSDWVKEHMPRLEPYRGDKDFEALQTLAREDNHGVMAPTDVIWLNGERVGYLSIARMPTVWAWLSTKKLKVRDSLQLLNTTECVLYKSGAPGMFLPCSTASPFYPYVEHLGFKNGGNYDFFFKEF